MHTYICTSTTLHYTTLHYMIYTFYYIVLGYATLDYIALPCIALHLRLHYKRTSTHTKKIQWNLYRNFGAAQTNDGDRPCRGSWQFLGFSAQEDFWYFGPFRSGTVYGNDWWHGLGGPIWGAKGVRKGLDAGGLRCWNVPTFLRSDRGDKVYSPVQWKIPNKWRFSWEKKHL